MVSQSPTPLRTSADDLLDVVRRQKKVAVDQLAKTLKVPLATVQALIDFLVEEKILGIEYKFTTPYVYLNETAMVKHEQLMLSKEEFYQRSRSRSVPEGHIAQFWAAYREESIPKLRQGFMAKAYARGAGAQQAEEMWQKYRSYF